MLWCLLDILLTDRFNRSVALFNICRVQNIEDPPILDELIALLRAGIERGPEVSMLDERGGRGPDLTDVQRFLPAQGADLGPERRDIDPGLNRLSVTVNGLDQVLERDALAEDAGLERLQG